MIDTCEKSRDDAMRWLRESLTPQQVQQQQQQQQAQQQHAMAVQSGQKRGTSETRGDQRDADCGDNEFGPDDNPCA